MFIEDYEVGRRHLLGRHHFTAEDIIAFARKFDPQPFHIDPKAAAKSHFGGLVASGWHTASIWMRLNLDARRRMHAECLARGEPVGRGGPSPGWRDMVWRRPVRPGDTLTYANEVLETRISASRPGWGLLTIRASATNQHADEVFSFVAAVFVESRGGAGAGE